MSRIKSGEESVCEVIRCDESGVNESRPKKVEKDATGGVAAVVPENEVW